MIEARVEGRTRIATYRGVVDGLELRRYIEELIAAPDFDPTLDSLVDLRELSDPRFTSADVGDVDRRFRSIVPPGAHRRVAIVASAPLVYGYARAFENQHGDGDEVRIFDDMDAARTWLGLARSLSAD